MKYERYYLEEATKFIVKTPESSLKLTLDWSPQLYFTFPSLLS